MISVILPIFGSSDILKGVHLAIESILAQTFTDLELILVDDGCDDIVRDLLKTWEKKDSRIRLLESKRLGLTRSLNRGISTAQGDLIARQDADDVSLPTRLFDQKNHLESSNCDLVAGAADLIDSENRSIGRDTPPQSHEAIAKALLRTNCLVHPTILVRREKLNALGGYDETFSMAQDYDLYLRGLEAGWTFGGLSTVVLRRKLASGSVTVSRRKEQLRHAMRANAGYFRRTKSHGLSFFIGQGEHLARLLLPNTLRRWRRELMVKQ